MEGQKSVCMDPEFASLFSRDCLIYTVEDEPEAALGQDIANFDCQVRDDRCR